MCSTREARLASLRAAIDEVALAAQADRGEHADLGELAARLASLWAMIAELDPGLAARLRGYCPDTNLGTRSWLACGSQPWQSAGHRLRGGPCSAGAGGCLPEALSRRPPGPWGSGARVPGRHRGLRRRQ